MFFKTIKAAICRWYVKNWKEEIDNAVEAGADNIKIQTLGGPHWKYPVYPYNYYDYYKKGEIISRMVEAVRNVKDRYQYFP
jgi:sulfur relay (sulfurtransferase) DsrC/TusE family protein